jgi:hypothetical protein
MRILDGREQATLLVVGTACRAEQQVHSQGDSALAHSDPAHCRLDSYHT